jgi:hypothetical protein
MPKASVRYDEVRKIRRALKEFDPELERELKGEFREEASRAAADAGSLVRSRTGALARSYRPFVTLRAVGVRSPLPYAGVYEFGGTIYPRGVPITFARSEPVTRTILRRSDAILDAAGEAVDRAARSTGWK